MASETLEWKRNALLLIEKLKARVEELESSRTGGIAIVGLACRFPGAANAEAFWELLEEGREAIVEVPRERWNIEEYFDADPEAPGRMYTRYGGFLEEVDRFDAGLFGISPREAVSMDPQQRVLLESSWEALENAGYGPLSQKGKRGGVYVGVGSNEYAEILRESAEGIDAYYGAGNAANAIAGRVAYALGLEGPAMAIDTACSSSLVAVHQACQGLRLGECDVALAGGVNLMLRPATTIATCRARMLSAEGRCKTFDESADGYVRGEGCGVVVLKRLKDAERDGDRVRGVIVGSAVNQDGASSGLTVPNGPAQERVIREALEQAGLKGSEVEYLEAHGTGTKLGDPIEVEAAAAVLGEGRKGRLVIGSVKTNIGHLEAASGVAGLVKVVLGMEHGRVPRHLHVRELNRHIRWGELGVEVAVEGREWKSGRRLAGVSSFGFTGTNAHVVVERVVGKEEKGEETEESGEQVLVLSAKSEGALRELAGRYGEWMRGHAEASLAEVCYTAGAGRSHLEERAALVARSTADAVMALDRLAAGQTAPNVHRGRRRHDAACVWLFGGADWPIESVRHLCDREPAFRAVLERCGGAGDSSTPPLIVLQVALAELWRSWGIEPDTVAGDGRGQYAAAVVAGALEIEEGVRLFHALADLSNEKLRPERTLLLGPNAQAAAMRGVTVLLEMGPAAMCESLLSQWHGNAPLAIAVLRDGLAEAVAKLYVAGVTPGPLAWGRPRTKVELPPYPFQRQRYWPTPGPRAAAAAATEEYLLAGVRQVSAASGEALFHSSAGLATHPYLRDHVVHGKYVMPATGFACMAIAATGVPCRLSDVVISEPLIVAGEGERRMQLAIEAADGVPSFTIHTQADAGDGSKWRLHCRGRGEALGPDFQAPDADEPVAAIQERMAERDPEEFYRRSAGAGLALGAAFRGIRRLWTGEDDALAEIQIPKGLEGERRMPIHPAVLDSCSQVAGALIAPASDGSLFLPVQYRRLDLYAVAPSVFYCYGRLESSGSPETRHVELRLLDAAGGMLGQFRGFVLKRARPEGIHGPHADAEELLYEIRWEETGVVSAVAAEPGTWLLAGGSEFCRRLEAELGAMGHRSVHQLGDASQLEGVVISADEEAPERGVRTSLLLMQELIGRSIAPARGTWFVTKGAWSVGESGAVSPGGGMLWGFARSIRAERPALGCRLLDLDPAADIPFARIAQAVTCEEPMREEAWRGAARYVPRLDRRAPRITNDPVVRRGATYLVTGGLGALGRKTARWLAEQGAGHIVVTGRTAPAAEAAGLIAELARHNCQCYAVAADVSRNEDVERIRQSLAPLPPLRGIIHAAGIVDDGMVTEQTWERFERVLGPKVAGAWNLHRATLDAELDFFVLFSSLSSAVGAAAQSNYAAANGYLDALADFRRASGLPALSIHWGPWAEGGMASDRRLLARFRRQGLEPLRDREALAALGALLQSDRSQAAVLRADWPRYGESLGSAAPAAMVERLVPKPVAEGSPLLETAMALPPEKRIQELERQIGALVRKVLSLNEAPDPNDGFFDIGMDSLSAVELANLVQAQLGKSYEIPSTTVFDYPSVSSLVRYLAELTTGRSAERAQRPAAKRAVDREPIAIVGVGCRFPGGGDPGEFWKMLSSGGDGIREVPPDRWDVDAFYDTDPDAPGKMTTRFGGFIRDIERFDPGFFGISPREAESMDPQHRLLLEVAWEALEDAAIAPPSLMGTAAGVFIGISTSDYTQMLSSRGVQSIDQYFGSGNSHSTAAGRLSFVLGLEGPCFTVDTACSASLVALHQACRALRAGDCSAALVGGVNATLIPDNTVYFSKARMMAPDGRCKTFDAAADGYVRGEGCGVVVLKPYRDAVRDGDRIWGLVRGSAMNQDGRSSGLTVPNGPAQERVIREALAEARVEPEEVSYVEAHGTGTALGDPIELTALQGVFGPFRDPRRPLLVGSVKTNIGHLEAAAGMAGLIKVLLAMRHGRIPAHLHFRNPTPRIPWDRYALRVVTETTEWPARRRIAGISSFAFSGTNAHVVVEAPPVPEANAPRDIAERGCHVLVLSARSRAGLSRLAASWRQWLDSNPACDFADVCFTASTGRAHFEERAAIAAASAGEAAELLAKLESGESHPEMAQARTTRERPRCAWLFPGQGSQYPGMARELYRQQPVFRAELDRCHDILAGEMEQPLLPLLFEEAEKVHDTRFAQPALFAVEMSLAAFWRSLALEPDAVLGHSVGQYAAACVSGVFSLEDGLRLLARRGRLMADLPEAGAMAAIFCEPRHVKAAIASRSDLWLAAENGREAVVSGTVAAVEAFMGEFAGQGVAVRRLATSQAFHSGLIEGMLDEFERFARNIEFHTPRVPLICNITGRAVGRGDLLDAGYWREHARRPVAFAAGVAALEEIGCRVFLEVGPGTTLSSLAAGCIGGAGVPTVPSLRRGRSDERQIALAAGTLYTAGLPVDFRAWDGPWQRHKISLPSYPFERQRCWAAGLAPAGVTSRGAAGASANRDQQLATGQRIVTDRLSVAFQPWLGDHRVFGEVVAPAAMYLSMALATGGVPGRIRDAVFSRAMQFGGEAAERDLQLILEAPEVGGRRRFEFFSRNGKDAWVSHSVGYWECAGRPEGRMGETLDSLRSRLRSFPVDQLYELSSELGIEFGPGFRGLAGVWIGEGEALGEIRPPRHLGDVASAVGHPAVLDCVLQLAGAAIRHQTNRAHVPFECGRFELYGSLPASFWCYAHARDAEPGAETRIFDLRLVDRDDHALGEIEGLVAKRASIATMIDGAANPVERSLYRVEWREVAEESPVRADFWPTPGELANEMEPVSRTIGAGLEEQHRKLERELEAASRRYILRAFAELGAPRAEKGELCADDLMGRLGIVPRYRRLVGRMLQIVAGDPASEPDQHIGGHPLGEVEFALLDRCGQSLASVLRGGIDPLELLFPREGIRAEDLYRKAPRVRLFNDLVGRAFEAALRSVPAGRKLRVLEIGAGTGATTAALLPALGSLDVEYSYTDISAAFFADAEARLAEYPFLHFQVLDIERDPRTQGFADHAYDLVIAANVLHATRDLEVSLRHARRLLASGGLLAVIEGLKQPAWLDLTFGLLDGWWRFDDKVRTGHALVSGERWRELLASEGFTEAQALSVAALPGQALLISRAPAEILKGDLPAGSWLIAGRCDGLAPALGARLEERNQRCFVAELEEDWRGILNARPDLTGAIYVGTEGPGCAGALALVQVLVAGRLPADFHLWFVTRGAHVLGSEVAPDIAQAPLWGMGRVVAIEHPELHCRRIDLDPDDDLGRQLDLLSAALVKPDLEDEIVLRGDRRLAPRLTQGEPSARLAVPGSRHHRLQPGENGTLEALEFVPCVVAEPGPGEVQVKVSAGGLNFRDVLEAMRALPVEIGPLGSELSGRVTAVGSGTSEYAVGDEVFGFGAGTFADVCNVPANLVAPKPDWLSHADAATLPVAFATAEMAFRLADLRPGERLLIHAAAGGVGLAAVQLAQAIGAEIFATASRPKHAYLRSLGVAHVYDSRSTDYAHEILADTGTGVHVVVNSLTSKGFIEATLEALAPGGRFVELSKRSVWPAARMAAVRSDVRYNILALDRILEESPGDAGEVLRDLASRAASRSLRPLRSTVFPMADSREGFQMMRHARHIGKIVFANAADALLRFDPGRAFLITGGTGGLGLELARWMVDRGARCLVLNSRRAPSGDTVRKIEELRARGPRIDVVLGDISSEAEVRRILSTIDAPLEGVFHLAGTLRDGALINQTPRNFEEVLAPKVDGAWHLHRLTAGRDLRWFVLFSSTASLLGNSGQANHAAANSFLDELAEYRRSLGLPAISINWGAWSEIGSAIHGDIGSKLEAMGVDWISPELGFAALERIMARSHSRQAVLPIRWNVFRRTLGGSVPPLLSELAPAAPAETPKVASDILGTLAETPAANHPAVLGEYVAREVQQVLRLASPPNANTGFSDLGMDSLMAVELRNRLNRALPLDPPLSSTALFDHPSIAALSSVLAGSLSGGASGRAPVNGERDETGELSDEELSQLLAGKIAAVLGMESIG